MDEPKTPAAPLSNGAARIHLDTIELALEQAQACLLGETPEDGTPDEARQDTLDKVRAALIHHVPAVRRKL